MIIQQLNSVGKEVSEISLFKGEVGETISQHIFKGTEIPKHQTPALLICVVEEIVFGDGNGATELLNQGNYLCTEYWLTTG